MSDFDPWDTRADPVQIKAGAAGLRRLSGVLLGHGDNVGAVLNEVALSFSDVIAADVAAQIAGNARALETAVEATEYGQAVGNGWAKDVETFKAARDELIYRWELAEIDDFGVEPPLNLWPRPEPEEADRLSLEHRVAVAEARTAALRDFTLEGQSLWENFQVQVTVRARMFREGPTAENLALVVSYLGWGAMTLWPEIAPAPVTGAEGAADGATVLAGLDHAAGPQAVTEALADVAAITSRAASGQTLTPDEIDYLAAFYETLGRRVTEIPDYLSQTSFAYTTSAPTSRTDDESPPVYTDNVVGGLDPATVGALTAASANGMLVLLRNGPGGGGYTRLPTWVRDALDGDQVYVGPPTSPVSPPQIGLGSDFEALIELGELLDHSSVEAGTGLSHELAISTQHLVQLGNDAAWLFPEDVAAGVLADVDRTGSTYLNVVGRNDEACYDLLLGEDMPADYDPAALFADLYGFEWSDEGDSAGQLTDFILHWEEDGTTDQSERADLAMSRLVEITTSPEIFGALMDDVGTSGDPDSSALGQVNPAITAHLGALMVTYFDEFSGLSADSPIGEISTLDRVRFTTLLCTDDATAGALTLAVDGYERDILGEFPTVVGVNELGGAAGRLQGVLDSGLMNASMDVTSDEAQAAERAYQVRQFAYRLADATAGALPPPFSVLVGATSALIAAGDGPADMVTSEGLDPAEYESETMVQRQYDTSVAALQSMIDADLVDGSALAALTEQGLVVGDTVVRSPAAGLNAENLTDHLIAATDAAATAAGLNSPGVQELINDIEQTYGEIVQRYQAENPEEYEQLIQG